MSANNSYLRKGQIKRESHKKFNINLKIIIYILIDKIQCFIIKQYDLLHDKI